MKALYIFAAALLGTGLAACSAQKEQESSEATPIDGGTASPEEGKAVMSEFEGTAWRVSAEDGARYVTYFDSEGRYRDLRNGNPWREGSWSFDPPTGEGANNSSLLCLTPDGDNVRERCWQPGRVEGDTLIMKSGGGRRIQLEKVAYQPPENAPAPTPEAATPQE